MASTQDHLTINDVKNDTVLLKDGSFAVVLQTSAVNFGLLSDQEQLAIISSFAGMLNSLSFMIQIIIRSKKLDITTYLQSLDEAQKKQRNPLLASMISRYKTFITQTVAENEVLDKQFYIIINVSGLEIGLMKDPKERFKKAQTLLIPRRDHLFRQLGRIGLKADQLTTEQLTRLFYDIYNPSGVRMVQTSPVTQEAVTAVATQIPLTPSVPAPTRPLSTPQVPPAPVRSITDYPKQTPQSSPQPSVTTRRSPYVVEELPEDYSHV